MSIAGEWAGFDAAWLEASILRSLASPWRWLRFLSPASLIMARSQEWQATRQAVTAIRAGPPQERDAS